MTQLIIWILNQFKDYSLCTTGASLMKRDVHHRLIVIYIIFVSFMKFISEVTYLWLIVWIINQFKGYNSRTTKASLTKLDVHHTGIKIHSISVMKFDSGVT